MKGGTERRERMGRCGTSKGQKDYRHYECWMNKRTIWWVGSKERDTMWKGNYDRIQRDHTCI